MPAARKSGFDLSRSPSGAWFRRTGDGFEAGATVRSVIGYVAVPFWAFWAVTVVLMFRGFENLRGSSTAEKAFLVLVAAIAVLALISLFLLFGRVVVRVEGGRGRVFTGLGPIGWPRRFRWDEIDTVREEAGRHTFAGLGSTIVLEGARRIRFGFFLADGRRYYLVKALEAMLAERREPDRG